MRPTGIILAGGAARRLQGRNKALLEVGGRPLLARALDALAPVCAEILLVAKDLAPFGGWADRLRLVPDPDPGFSPAVGLRQGLAAANDGYCVVVACDMPFLDAALPARLLALAAGHDAAALRRGELVEPLLAVYHSRCLAPLARRIEQGDHRLRGLLAEVRTAYLDWDEPAPRAAFNINRPADLRLARRLARG